MKILIYDKLAPTTFRFGFLNCSLERMREAFINWKRPHSKSLESIDISVPLEAALERLQPLTSVPRRWLLVATGGDWVAYFDNGKRGADPSPVSHLCSLMECRGVFVTSIPHTKDEKDRSKPGVYGAVQFELFSPHKTDFLNCERAISVANDGGQWKFSANGKVQSFEDVAQYRNRRVIDRFTTDMLIAYCRSLGIQIDCPDFYQKRGSLIWSNDPLPSYIPAETISQVQAQYGITTGTDCNHG